MSVISENKTKQWENGKPKAMFTIQNKYKNEKNVFRSKVNKKGNCREKTIICNTT